MEVEEGENSPLMGLQDESNLNTFTPPLIQASVDGDSTKLRQLLESGVDPNQTDYRGRNAAHLAACRGSAECLQILDEAGCDVTAVDNQGNTPLHLCGHLETVTFLTEHGARVNVCNNQGQTPLKMAERRVVDRQVIELLEKLTRRTGKRGAAYLLGKMHDKLGSYRELGVNSSNSVSSQNAYAVAKDVWWEFADSLGVKKLILLMLCIAMLSLYIACVSSGIIPLVVTA
ncbi:ankyrin repeat domain-containing protein 46-like [Glandiceps talaboti]